MMKRHLVRLFVLVPGMLLVLAGSAAAQEWLWGLSYGFSVPTGNTKDFTDDFSWRNINLEGRRIDENRKMSLGLIASWNVFFEKSNRTSELLSVPGSVTGTQYRYINSWPILANAHYYFGEPYGVRPFVGINLGAYIIEARTEIGLVAAAETNVHFGGAPEIGLAVPRGHQIWFLNARYHAIMKAGNVPSQNYLAVSLGVTTN
ncbi:MAG TPA: hypothetical protein VFP10_14640 [Candidatus Eisenbacteria bacterium]|nr:hypothetical protein [Candidatus Eisenbacteria bacterium]